MNDFAAPSEPTSLAETDLAIAHALQIAPRAPWSAIGDVLGLSPATVARRWGRLVERGEAWVTATASPELCHPLCNAFLDVRCHPADRGRVALALARDPRTKSVMEVASGRDLLAQVVTRDLPALSRFVLDQVSHLPGVVDVDTQVSPQIYQSGRTWRLDSLTRSQCERLHGAADTSPGTAAHPESPSAADIAMLLALAPDGRMPVTDLAELTGSSHTAARRRLARLQHSGAVAIRCEISKHLTGWPVTSVLRGRVAHEDRLAVCARLAKMPGIRMLGATSGSTNLLAYFWLRSTTDVLQLEEQITADSREFEIVEHSIVLRERKRIGWVLDELGRAVECAPINPWCDDPALDAA